VEVQVSDKLWQSFANVVRISDEAEALLESLETVLEGQDFGRFLVDLEDSADEVVTNDSDWCTIYYWVSYRVLERMPKPASRGMLAIGLSMFRNEDLAGNEWEGARSAKLYAGFAPTARAWTEDTLVVDGNGNSPSAKPISSRRWGTVGRDGKSPSWFFCVTLASLQSRKDLVREVVDPLSKLINGAAEDIAFAGCRATIATGA